MFEEMILIAKNKLAIIDEVIEGLPAPQVTVLLYTSPRKTPLISI